jgi:hypothetical protein
MNIPEKSPQRSTHTHRSARPYTRNLLLFVLNFKKSRSPLHSQSFFSKKVEYFHGNSIINFDFFFPYFLVLIFNDGRKTFLVKLNFLVFDSLLGQVVSELLLRSSSENCGAPEIR